MEKLAICYYRVSTDKQGESGLGLEAQETVAKAYCESNGYAVIDEYTEIVSGKINDREAIQQALADCEDKHATLVVAKLDRISRDVEFIAALQKSPVEFICADMPQANSSMIQFMSVFAQYEREQISARTKAALQAKKLDPNVQLGNPNLAEVRNTDTTAATAKRHADAQAFAQRIEKRINAAREAGCVSLVCIARWLTDEKIKTRKGKDTWTPTAVSRVLRQLETVA